MVSERYVKITHLYHSPSQMDGSHYGMLIQESLHFAVTPPPPSTTSPWFSSRLLLLSCHPDGTRDSAEGWKRGPLNAAGGNVQLSISYQSQSQHMTCGTTRPTLKHFIMFPATLFTWNSGTTSLASTGMGFKNGAQWDFQP